VVVVVKRRASMRRRFFSAVLVAGFVLASLAATATSALAAGPENNTTVGDCMSDILYGNEPNMANGAPGGPAEQESGTQAGNVVSTQSPGPWVNNPADPDNPFRGRSAGQFMQDGINVPLLCRLFVATQQ
jgi:hypothetical protein